MVRTAAREPVIYGTAWTRIKDSMALVEIRALRLENRIAAPVQEQRRGRVSRPDFVPVEPRRGPIEVHAKLAIVVADGIGLVLGMIEQVKKVKGELHLNPLSNPEVLPEREVDVVAARSQAGPITGTANFADLEPIQSEPVGVEPLPGVACVGAATLARNTHWDLVAASPSRGKVTNGGTPHYTRHRGSGCDADD